MNGNLNITKKEETAMILRGLLLATALVAHPAFADGDSSSDAADGFVQSLSETEGLIVQVPVNAAGEELVAEAVTRIAKTPLTSTSDFATAFNASATVDTDRAVSDLDVSSDSSTSGWYYGGSTYSRHTYYRTTRTWCSDYYRTYRPTYYSRGYSYSYRQPVYRTYVGHRSHYGQYYGTRYYYYGRGW
jgi:hypothetical protein